MRFQSVFLLIKLADLFCNAVNSSDWIGLDLGVKVKAISLELCAIDVLVPWILSASPDHPACSAEIECLHIEKFFISLR